MHSDMLNAALWSACIVANTFLLEYTVANFRFALSCAWYPGPLRLVSFRFFASWCCGLSCLRSLFLEQHPIPWHFLKERWIVASSCVFKNSWLILFSPLASALVWLFSSGSISIYSFVAAPIVTFLPFSLSAYMWSPIFSLMACLSFSFGFVKFSIYNSSFSMSWSRRLVLITTSVIFSWFVFSSSVSAVSLLFQFWDQCGFFYGVPHSLSEHEIFFLLIF